MSGGSQTPMISLSGFKPLEEMEIVFTGLRPGEKLSEELELAGERMAKTRHPKIFVGKIAPYAPDTVEKAVRWLRHLARDGEGESIREFLNAFLPEASLSSEAAPPPVPAGDPPMPATPRARLLFPILYRRRLEAEAL